VTALRSHTVLLILAFSIAGAARGQGLDPALEAVYAEAGIEEHLGGYISPDISLVDHEGRPITTGDIFASGRPVVLNFVYYDCPMLCNVVLDSFTRTMAGMDWSPGTEFDVITVSIAPGDTPERAAAARARYGEALGKPDAMAGWHFLTGTDEDVRALADEAGFKYKWVDEVGQYVHPAVLTFVAADRKITRYLYGIDYPVRKVKNAIGEASEGTVGTALDRLILYCFQYDPVGNAYVIRATNFMKLGGLLTIAGLATLFLFLRRRERGQGYSKTAFS
jgi:protein SCO1/2